jgi:hypothetical protein
MGLDQELPWQFFKDIIAMIQIPSIKQLVLCRLFLEVYRFLECVLITSELEVILKYLRKLN